MPYYKGEYEKLRKDAGTIYKNISGKETVTKKDVDLFLENALVIEVLQNADEAGMCLCLISSLSKDMSESNKILWTRRRYLPIDTKFVIGSKLITYYQPRTTSANKSEYRAYNEGVIGAIRLVRNARDSQVRTEAEKRRFFM